MMRDWKWGLRISRENFNSINEKIMGQGELGGLLEARDVHTRRAQQDIDRLAAVFIRDFNLQHAASTGLDNISNRDFFAGLDSSGGSTVTSSIIADPELLTFADYEIRFTDSTTYDIINTTTGSPVSTGNSYTSGSTINFYGLSIVVEDDTGTPAAGDVFQVNSYDGISTQIDLSPDVMNNLSAIAAGFTDAAGDIKY
jgi:flagellar hook-associated protein FlgK